MQTRDIEIDDCSREKLSNLAFLFIRSSYIARLQHCSKVLRKHHSKEKKRGIEFFITRIELFFFSFSNHVPILTKIYNSPSSEMAYLERILYTLLVNNFCNAFEEIETSFHFSCNASQRNIFNVLDVKLEKHT